MKPNGIWATGGANITPAATAEVSPPTHPSTPPPAPPQDSQDILSSTISSGIIGPVTTNSGYENISTSLPPIENNHSDTEEIAQPYPSPINLDILTGALPNVISDHLESENTTESATELPPIKVETPKPIRTTNKYAWNGDLEEIPVEVIIEPILKNKQRQHVLPGNGTSVHRHRTRNFKNPTRTSKFGM